MAKGGMHPYHARVAWRRGDARFVDQRYSRGHEWSFDGGVTVPASSSPHSVPAPYSVDQAVDPEEALVAATSSCHMLWFLHIASKRGFVVDEYVDDAFGVMTPNEAGKLHVSRVVLRPAVRFAAPALPTDEDVRAMHQQAHEECFIANSIRAVVSVEPA